jgi:hypothetical protein
MVKFECPSCGHKQGVASEHAGKPAQCPACRAPVVIPVAEPNPFWDAISDLKQQEVAARTAVPTTPGIGMKTGEWRLSGLVLGFGTAVLAVLALLFIWSVRQPVLNPQLGAAAAAPMLPEYLPTIADPAETAFVAKLRARLDDGEGLAAKGSLAEAESVVTGVIRLLDAQPRLSPVLGSLHSTAEQQRRAYSETRQLEPLRASLSRGRDAMMRRDFSGAIQAFEEVLASSKMFPQPGDDLKGCFTLAKIGRNTAHRAIDAAQAPSPVATTPARPMSARKPEPRVSETAASAKPPVASNAPRTDEQLVAIRVRVLANLDERISKSVPILQAARARGNSTNEMARIIREARLLAERLNNMPLSEFRVWFDTQVRQEEQEAIRQEQEEEANKQRQAFIANREQRAREVFGGWEGKLTLCPRCIKPQVDAVAGPIRQGGRGFSFANLVPNPNCDLCHGTGYFPIP